MQHSAVFTNVTELFILVPALLGLKGNLEMTLASRLSTQANLGNMDTRREKFKMIGGNMALIQVVDSVVLVLCSSIYQVEKLPSSPPSRSDAEMSRLDCWQQHSVGPSS